MQQAENYSVIGFSKGKETILAEHHNFEMAMAFVQKNETLHENISIAEERIVEDKPNNFLIVSDINLMLPELKLLLDRPTKFKEQFIFLGNFICPGKGFYEMMMFLCRLQKRRNCLFIRGRNEHNLLAYINGTKDYVGSQEEVEELITSIETELTFPVTSLKKRFPEFYLILNESLNFYENDHYIFTSGGLNLSLEGWKQSTKEELLLTTEEFLLGDNETNKRIVFGNIPVQNLNQNIIASPWFNRGRNKIGINGNCREGGKLLALIIHDNVPTFIGVRNIESRKKAVQVY